MLINLEMLLFKGSDQWFVWQTERKRRWHFKAWNLEKSFRYWNNRCWCGRLFRIIERRNYFNASKVCQLFIMIIFYCSQLIICPLFTINSISSFVTLELGENIGKTTAKAGESLGKAAENITSSTAFKTASTAASNLK